MSCPLFSMFGGDVKRVMPRVCRQILGGEA